MSVHATIPADRVFWAIIEAPGVRAGVLPAGLWPELEDAIPIESARLWAVVVPVAKSDTGHRKASARLIVCAARESDLAEYDARILTLTPESVPEFVPSGPPRSAFNLLIGRHVPASVRRVRLRRHCAAAACALLAACLCAVGLLRRADAWSAEADAAQDARRVVIASVAPEGVSWTPDDLTVELTRLRHASAVRVAQPEDAAVALAELIPSLPTHIACKPQSISASGTAASISIVIPGDAQPFLAALVPPAGWTMDEPRLSSVDKSKRLNLEFKRVPGHPRHASLNPGVTAP